jgi:tRNA dimethylallyltransferase
MISEFSSPLPCILIGGPTASGKSSYAIEVAQRCGGEIINIDSVQCYKDISIGAAKPSPEERARVPHHLFDLYRPDHDIDVVSFAWEVRSTVQGVLSRKRVPILVGSSGMYISVLFSGIAEIPSPPVQLRQEVRSTPTDKLYEELTRIDPERAQKLSPHDRQRIERSVEIVRTAGMTTAQAYQRHHPPFVRGPLCIIERSREDIRERIAVRTAKMVQSGLIEETRTVRNLYGSHAAVLNSIGYRQVRDYLVSGASMNTEALIETITAATRQYAKRQQTFWRNEPRKRGWPVQNLRALFPQSSTLRPEEVIERFLSDYSWTTNDTAVYVLPCAAESHRVEAEEDLAK